MNRTLTVVAGAILLASVAAVAQQPQGGGGGAPQAGGQPPAPATLAVGLQRAYATIKTNLNQAAEKMADGDFTFQPVPEIRSFGGQLGHVANFHYMFCAAAKGVPNPNMGQNLEQKTNKADFVKALADSFTFCDDAFSSLTDQSVNEMVMQGRGMIARGAVLSNLIAHDNEEYGIVTIYMRLKALVPPSTANAPQRGGGGGGGQGGGGGRRGGQ